MWGRGCSEDEPLAKPVPRVSREAATTLFVSEATIKTHLLHIYDKLGVRDRAAGVGEAYRRRLLP